MKKTKDLFNSWNNEKQNIEFNWKIKKVKKWEIWVTKIWVNIWSEISKDWKYLRPVLIVSNHMWWDLVWIIPITTKYNKNYDKFLIEIEDYNSYGLKEKSYFSINNFKTISLKRLQFKINWYFRKKQKNRLVSEKFIKKVLLTNLFNLL